MRIKLFSCFIILFFIISYTASSMCMSEMLKMAKQMMGGMKGHSDDMDMSGHSSGMKMESGKKQKVKCAYDGMEMYNTMMKAKKEKDGKTYYFCTKEQMDKFFKDPAKYLKNLEVGNYDITVNILSIKEHHESMEAMDMSMEDMDMEMDKKATHHLAINIADKKKGKKISDILVTISITDTKGKKQEKEVSYVDMMEHYGVDVELAQKGKYEITLSIGEGKNEKSVSFDYEVKEVSMGGSSHEDMKMEKKKQMKNMDMHGM